MKIAITTSSFAVYSQEPLDLLTAAGLEYVLNPHGRKLTAAEVVDLCRDVEGVVAGTEPLNWEVLKALPKLKAISRCGVGMDNVDLNAAKELGVKVRNTPDGPTRAVAELTLGFVLDLLRQVTLMDRELRSGVWKKRMGRLLLGKRVGVVGFGRIGQSVGALLAAMGADIAYTDPVVDLTTHPRMSLEELMAWSEIVTLHCSKPKGQAFLIGGKELDMLPEGALLLNVSRGGLVDEAALYERLKSGRLAGAAVDVFNEEPYDGPLRSLPTAILTPHVGSYAREGRVQMELDSVRNLLEALGLPVKGGA